MKKLNPIFSLITLFFMTFTSCNHSNREQRLAKIDSLSIVLNKVDSMLAKDIVYDSILYKFNEIKKNKEAIEPILLKLSQKEKSDYNQFISSEKHFKNLIASYDKYTNELYYSRTQIAVLKSDFEKKAIKKDKFEEYYNTENKAVYLLFNSVKTEVFKTKKHNEKFIYFLPMVEEIMMEKGLKNKISN